MPVISEDELQAKRDRNAKLREQIEAEKAKSETRIAEQSAQIEATQLDAESARLQAELDATKEAAKVAAVRDGAAGPLESMKEQLKVAQSEQTPPGVTIDTNKNESEAQASSTETKE